VALTGVCEVKKTRNKLQQNLCPGDYYLICKDWDKLQCWDVKRKKANRVCASSLLCKLNPSPEWIITPRALKSLLVSNPKAVLSG